MIGSRLDVVFVALAIGSQSEVELTRLFQPLFAQIPESTNGRFSLIGIRRKFKRFRLFQEHRFSKDETVVKEGSVGDSFFLIDSGEAGVF